MSIRTGTFNPLTDAYVDVRVFGADTTDTDCTGAIQRACDTAAGLGGIVFIPAGTWVVAGTVTIQPGVEVRGAGAGATVLSHTGNGVCLDFDLNGSFTVVNAVRDLQIDGNSGASAVGVRVSDTWGFKAHNLVIQDYTAGIGFQLFNDANWTEGTEAVGVRIRNCAVGVAFTRSAASTFDSFGYTRFLGVSVNVPANGVGVVFGDNSLNAATHYIYDSMLVMNFWLDDNAVGVEFTADSTGTANYVHLTGENESGATGTRSFATQAPGFFRCSGIVNIEADTTTFPSDFNVLVPIGPFANGARLELGSGTPEGDVTAPVGSVFLRTDGGATTTLYVKTSGTGNTGWTAK